MDSVGFIEDSIFIEISIGLNMEDQCEDTLDV